MKIYKGKISKLKPNQIFVFGSNTEGRHGAGSALFALQNCGAIYGQAKGLQGQSYGIVTKDLTKKVHPSISMEYIIEQIKELYKFAEENEDKEFLIAYSGKGYNLNGYTPKEMAQFFGNYHVPKNIIFEENFFNLIKESREEGINILNEYYEKQKRKSK